ncbi:MAG: hypothetical protein EAZ87_19015 [Nostocales cyanobacterium]|nr:MAG: hypothetical protein EAZ87_19015 [Nostocales cyanobacterium]
MVFPILAAFAAIGSWFNGLVVARNANKSTQIAVQREKLEETIARQNRENNLTINQNNIQAQFSIAHSQLEQAKQLADEQKLTQLKIAYLNLIHQSTLQENSQEFQINLEKDRQLFELKCQELSQQHQ